jgi:hypothetical protein
VAWRLARDAICLICIEAAGEFGGIGCLVLLIRNFARSRPTFTMSGQSPMQLLALTVL